VWGSGPRDVYATCTQGIVHFDGTRWTRLAPSTSFGAIWGSGPGDVFAVNSMGIAHFDGTRWIQMTGVSSGPRSGMVNAISGTGPRDVFAVGADGLILHYQGSAWVFWLGPPGAIKAMWGSSANDVYGVGNGFILHYDGTSWMSVSPPNARAFTAVWGSGPSDVYVTSGDDFPPMVYITHFNGSTWSEIIPPPGDDPGNGLTAIWGSGPHDVWAVGGRDIVVMTHYDGTGWTPVTMAPGLIAPITSLWGSGPNDIYAVGPIPPPAPAGGYPIYHWSGGPGWTALSVTSPGPLSAVWGSGPNDIYLTGTDLLLHYDGTSLTRIATAGQDLDALWGSGPSDVFAAGKAGSLLHFDGQQWLPIRVLLPMPDLSAMWGASAEDFWLGVGGSPVELVRTVLPGP
jgi:hypothetical protein